MGSWGEPSVGPVGSPMGQLSAKLRRLKPLLMNFHKQNFGNLSDRVAVARANLSKIQELCFRFPQDNFLNNLEKDLVLQYFELSAAEESYKKQKSIVSWLPLGDRNTKFFQDELSQGKECHS